MGIEDDIHFGTLDYAVFGCMLAVSTFIGLYFGFWAKEKQNTRAEYLMGGKNMGVIPVSCSLLAGYISGISLLGLPSEMYTYGTQLWTGVIAEFLSFLTAGVFFLPVLYNLQITSSYEYLELRYNATLRKLGSALYLFGTVLYIPIVMYAPALGFAQFTGLDLNILIIAICLICIFYTTLGGVKAVVWTDTVQTVMILLGVIAVAVLGTIDVGGVSEVFRRSQEGERIEFFNMSADPTMRHNFWNVMIGRFVSNLSICAVNQGVVQRYLAMPTIMKARITNSLLAIGWSLLMSFCCYTGLVVYAAFFDCDPISVGLVSKSDQILPYFVMKYTKHIPGLPGIFMAGVFSAALSTMSTSLNAMTGVIYEDFIEPNLKNPMPESRASLIMKIMAVFIGAVTVLLATLVGKLGGVIQTTYSVGSISHGTIFTIYMLGMFCPWVNSIGALSGALASMTFVSWLTFGTQVAIGNHQITFPKKPFSIDGCDNSTLLMAYAANFSSIVPMEQDLSSPFPLYRLSYIYYTVVSVATCSVVAIVVSLLTGLNDPSKMDENLFCPQIRRFFNFTSDETTEKRDNTNLISLSDCGGDK